MRKTRSRSSVAGVAAASAAAEAAAVPPTPQQLGLPELPAPASIASPTDGDVKPKKRRKKAAAKAQAVPAEVVAAGDLAITPAGKAAAAATAAAAAATHNIPTPLVEEAGAEQAAEEEEAGAKKKRARRRREPDPLPFEDPTPELLQRLLAEGYKPPPRPVPNLGYACLNTILRALKPPIFTSRDCIKRTLDAKGLPYLGELCLANCKDLARMIQWNHEHSIRCFRMSSVLWPWMGTFKFEELPQREEITVALRFAGDLARLYGQRLTFHPSHFVKLAAPDDALVTKSITELEAHSQIMDLMGYAPSHENKINIHVGGVYSTVGSKEETMDRWAASFRRLSPACRARLTVENDDVASAFSLEDLLYLHRLTGVPLVFDFHHHRFCPGNLTEEEAFKAAVATWPAGVRPMVHWSESQPGRKPHAHSDYVRNLPNLYGLEAEVDIMVESKAKELAVLCFRGDLPYPPDANAPKDVPEEGEESGGE